ncbi:MAG: DUF1761 domain-containing protein [Halieaceae bacterium]|jgi:hypothetical protein|uniref:DUF1761 domain-containing protein n=1 Tax=Haliea alexandrii TaxID=2448162 RepID=UPI000F0BD79F|nr:DUF1761 domain-containing protein [Haliea alexandrii]MCR9184901.1 DUF1761 domain-containing protein [Halieaceae bacterium]
MAEVPVHFLAVLAATFTAFVIGGLWYSPLLFGAAWMRAAGLSEAQVNSGNKARIFGLAFVFLLVMALCLERFLAAPGVTLVTGTLYGFLTGFGWLFFATGVITLFEQRPWSYLLVNGGYWVVALTAMGAVLGGWR